MSEFDGEFDGQMEGEADPGSDDPFEVAARAAGAALRHPAPEGAERAVRHALRRRQVVRVATGSVVAVVAAVVAIVVLRPEQRSIGPSGSVPSTSAPTVATTGAPVALVELPYTLADMPGLKRLGEAPIADSMPNPGHLTMVWAGPGGLFESFVVLHEEPAEAPSTPCPTDPCEEFPVPTGEAWMLTHPTSDGQPHFEVMWWREGVLWTIRQYGLTAPQLQEAALAILPGSGLPYVLPLDGYEFVGMVGTWESTFSQWTLDGLPLTLAVTSGGVAQQLSLNSYEALNVRMISGVSGYEMWLVGGGIRLAWPVPVEPTDSSNDRWMSVMIPSELVGRVDEIIAAITAITAN